MQYCRGAAEPANEYASDWVFSWWVIGSSLLHARSSRRKLVWLGRYNICNGSYTHDSPSVAIIHAASQQIDRSTSTAQTTCRRHDFIYLITRAPENELSRGVVKRSTTSSSSSSSVSWGRTRAFTSGTPAALGERWHLGRRGRRVVDSYVLRISVVKHVTHMRYTRRAAIQTKVYARSANRHGLVNEFAHTQHTTVSRQPPLSSE